MSLAGPAPRGLEWRRRAGRTRAHCAYMSSERTGRDPVTTVPRTQAAAFGGGGSGETLWEEGGGKGDASRWATIGSVTAGANSAGAGTHGAVTTAKPVGIWSQKHGPWLGIDAGPVMCIAWWRQAAATCSDTAPGPAASQQAAATNRVETTGLRRIGGPQFTGRGPSGATGGGPFRLHSHYDATPNIGLGSAPCHPPPPFPLPPPAPPPGDWK